METDSDLVAAVARGDEAAFTDLFDRHGAAVLRYAWAVVDDRQDVDDVVQEVFLVAWRRRKALPDAVLPWLLVTARNIAYNANRRRRRSRADELPTDAAAAASPGDELRWVLNALAALPEVERRLVELCLIDGLAYEVAAAQVGLTSAAARKRVQRAREKLRAARDES